MTARFDTYVIHLYIRIGLLVVVYCLMGFFKPLFTVWCALWTFILSFAFAHCEVATAHTITVNMIASQLAMLFLFAVLPAWRFKPRA